MTGEPLGRKPLAPLAVLLFTGLYMFVLPYTAKYRNRKTELQAS